MVANYHTHTHRCHHATGTEREYIEKAIAEGLDTLGFSDHVPMPFADGHESSFRIFKKDLEDYIRTLESLREEYRGKIDILIGFEAEYYPDVFEDMMKLINQYDYDYLIMGQHFLGNEVGERSSGTATEDEERLKRYVDQVIEGISTGKYSYIAHPDIVGYTLDDEIYERHIRRLCEKCLEMDIPLEINLLGLRTHRAYPKDRFFRIAAKVGNSVVLGCDAHAAQDMAIPENLAEGYAFAKQHGLRVLDRVALRDPKK